MSLPVLGSPLVRIALGAIVSTWAAPKIINRFVYTSTAGKVSPNDPGIELDTDTPEARKAKESIADMTAIGITSAITVLTFVALGMAGGKSVAAAAAPGGTPGAAGAAA